MPIALYMDHNVHGAIVRQLRARGVDVLTAEEDGNRAMSDSGLLDRANALERLLFTNDKDFLVETARRQREGIPFHGVVYANQLTYVGRCIEDLEIVSNLLEPEDTMNSVVYLPLFGT